LEYKYPPALEAGDTIAVIAPCSAAQKDKVEQGLAYLADKGFLVKIAKNLTAENGIMAGTKEERINSLHEFWADPEVKALFCVRGGYGIQQILPELNYDMFSSNPKILVGYSDISALSCSILAKSNLITYSGPMVASDMGENFNQFSEEMLWRTLMGNPKIPNPSKQPLIPYRNGTAEGVIIGGTLTVLLPYLGTSYMPNLEGAILVLEDIGENPGRLDRHFHHLKFQGVFDQISGLVLGKFEDCFTNDEDHIESLTEILDSTIEEYDFPVLMNFAYGHINKRVTLPFGAKAKITADPPQFELIR